MWTTGTGDSLGRVRSRLVLLVAFAVLTASSASGERAPAPDLGPIHAAFGLTAGSDSTLTDAQRVIAARAGSRLLSLCPSCRLATIAEEGPCGWARTNRRIIAAAVAKGFDEDAIVARYVRTFGPTILEVPKDRGFAAASWIVPYAAALLGLLAAIGAGLRLRRRSPPPTSEAAHPTPPAELERQLRDELAALD